jgi:hypothetical protein
MVVTRPFFDRDRAWDESLVATYCAGMTLLEW